MYIYSSENLVHLLGSEGDSGTLLALQDDVVDVLHNDATIPWMKDLVLA